MPKDTKERRYLNPAIPRTSRLLAYLEQTSRETGIAESQLLVLYASEYVRLIVDGADGAVPSVAVPHAPMAISPRVVADLSSPVVGTQGGMRTLELIGVGEDENFESFGDPD
jgi:hypothetical protein